jgi:hypothetical protein
VVEMCGGACRQFHEVDRLKPAQSVPENTSVGGPKEDFLVLTEGGDEVGCLSVLIESSAKGEDLVNVSSATSCSAAQLSSSRCALRGSVLTPPLSSTRPETAHDGKTTHPTALDPTPLRQECHSGHDVVAVIPTELVARSCGLWHRFEGCARHRTRATVNDARGG